jgi:rhomboid protease GluP
MTRYRPWLGQPQETPLSYVILLAWAVLMYPGRRSGSEQTLADWARHELCAVGYLVQQGEPWRLLSYSCVHGGLLHVLFNAASWIALAPALERWLGPWRFALLYVVGALAAGVAGVFWHGPWSPLVGGSGALFALMGAILALNMRAGRHLLDFLEVAGARSFLSVIVANLILGWVIPFVSNAAHLGGLLAGFVLTFCFLERGRTQADGVARMAQAGWALLLVTTTLYTCWPVARGDYLLSKVLTTDDVARQRTYWEALRFVPPREARQEVPTERWVEMVEQELQALNGK